VVLIRHDDEVCTLFGVADTLRPSGRQVLAELKARGIRTVMLTGDAQAVAAEIGRQAGIDEVRAGLLPEDKVSAIAALKRPESTALCRVAQRQNEGDCDGQCRACPGGEGDRLRTGGGGPGDAVDGHRRRCRGVRGCDPVRHATAPDDCACISGE